MHQAIAASPRHPLTSDQQHLATVYLPMARALARSFKMAWPALRDEFDSAAALALVEAAESFDPSRYVRFSTFARIRIWGALLDAKRRQVPLGYRKEPRRAPCLCPMPPQPEESGRVLTSEPDEPVGRDFEAVEQVERWLKMLPRRHALACRQIYLHDATHHDVARLLGCSQSRIANMHRQSMALLNETLAASSPRRRGAAG